MISVFGSDLGEAEIVGVTDSIERQWVGMGEKVEEFEHQLRDHLGVEDVALVDSGSNALMLAVKVLDLPPGSEVIVPTVTWVACAHAVRLAGLNPVFCDVDVATGNVTADSVRQRISPRTSAIMVVHYAGRPVDMDEIRAFGLPIIEDAAHAISSSIGDTPCGSLGDIAILSFDPVKNLATSDSGCVAGRADLVAQARRLRYCGLEQAGYVASKSRPGRWWEQEIVEAYPRFIPNDVAAAFGLAQLERLPELQARRKSIWETYQSELIDISGLHLPPDAEEGTSHSYFTYLVRVENRRDELANELRSKGIYTTFRYQPLHLTDYYRTDYRLVDSERLNEEGLNLPLHPRLSHSDIEEVVEAVRSFL